MPHTKKQERWFLRHDNAYAIAYALRQSIFKHLDKIDEKNYAAARAETLRKFGKSARVMEVEDIKILYDGKTTQDLDFFGGMQHDVYEPEVTNTIKKLKGGDTFIDVGANSGYFTLLAAKCVGEEGVVLAFEPTPSTFRRLEKNIALNGFKNIVAYNMALGNRNELMNLYISKSDGQNSFATTVGKSGHIKVPLKRLDSILKEKEIDLMKIDTEGWEYEVIDGCGSLTSKIKAIVLEYNHQLLHEKGEGFDNVFKLLERNGFKITELNEDGSIGTEVKSHRDLSQFYKNLYAVRQRL